MELASRCLCWISCIETNDRVIRLNRQLPNNPHLNGRGARTYVKVVASVLQDELGGVWLVLTVVHIHLELIGLNEERVT